MLIPKTKTLDIGAAGTQEQFTTTKEIIPPGRSVWVRAHPTNTGVIYIGDKNVSAATGHVLDKLDPPFEINVDESWDISDLWADAATNGDDVSMFWMGEA